MLKAGNITVHFLNAGFWWDDGGAQFGIVPRELWEKEKPANARHRIKMSLTCPLILTGQAVILVIPGSATASANANSRSILLNRVIAW